MAKRVEKQGTLSGWIAASVPGVALSMPGMARADSGGHGGDIGHVEQGGRSLLERMPFDCLEVKIPGGT